MTVCQAVHLWLNVTSFKTRSDKRGISLTPKRPYLKILFASGLPYLNAGSYDRGLKVLKEGLQSCASTSAPD